MSDFAEDTNVPTNDCISRQAAIDAINIGNLHPGIISSLKSIIEEIPSAEPKKGRWTVHGEPPMYVIECSCCGQKYFNHVGQSLAKYCSNCGAKMEMSE